LQNPLTDIGFDRLERPLHEQRHESLPINMPAAAAESYGKALEMDPSNVLARVGFASSLAASEDWERAIENVDVAVCELKGEALVHLSRHAEAVEILNDCLRIGRSRFSILRLRGLAKSGLGMHRDAVDDFTAALRFFPNDGASYHARGLALVELGDMEGGAARLGFGL
ncbi:MAG: tetratricopeptide repeat protein, partial [Candidatus Eutrophobiaceae bacterium]